MKSVRLSFLPSPIHGVGGFALAGIRSCTQIIEYVGEKVTKAESRRRCEANNEYIFALDEAHDLDGSVDWNPARFINHSCAPNCDALCEEGRIWITAVRDIRAGEEITFNYGYDLEDYREHACQCGAAECVGYIIAGELSEHVRQRQQIAPDDELGDASMADDRPVKQRIQSLIDGRE